MIYFKKIACAGKYHDDQAIPDVIAYITRPDKTPNKIIYGVHVDMQNIAESMIAVSKKYKKYSRLRLHHFIITFEPKFKSHVDILTRAAEEICNYIGRTYQVVFALHEDTLFPHIHFVFNAVSFVNGYKYHGGQGDYNELVHTVKSILSAKGLYPLAAVNYVPTPNNPHE